MAINRVVIIYPLVTVALLMPVAVVGLLPTWQSLLPKLAIARPFRDHGPSLDQSHHRRRPPGIPCVPRALPSSSFFGFPCAVDVAASFWTTCALIPIDSIRRKLVL